MSGTGGVDASIPLQAGRGTTQPENPLQALGNVANTANALNQLKLFPGQQQLQQQAVQGGAVGLAKQINQAGYQALAPLLALPQGSITHSAFTGALGSIESNLGIPTSGIIGDVLQTAPSGDGPEFDARIRSLIASRSQEGGGAAVAQVTPQTGPTLDVGPTIQPTTVSPAGRTNPGLITPTGPTYTKGLTPGEASQPVQIGVVQPGQPNAGAPIMAPLGASPFANGGRIVPPAALRNPNGPAVPGTASGGVVTGLGTAQSSGLGAQGPTSNAAFQHISDQGVQARSQAAILDTMLGDTGQFVTGPGQEGINQFRKVAQRISPSVAAAFGVDPTSVAANESFDKFANQLADAQGAGSDARLAVNQGANPSSHLSPAGVDLIIRQLRGNADYLQAQGRLAANYPDQTNVRKFQTDLGDNLDPRVFQYARMTPEQKMAFYRSMPNKAEFQKSYYWSQAHNLLPPPVSVAAPAAPVSAVAPSIPTNE